MTARRCQRRIYSAEQIDLPHLSRHEERYAWGNLPTLPHWTNGNLDVRLEGRAPFNPARYSAI